MGVLALFILVPNHSIAGDQARLSIGPQYGFSRSEPVLGRRQIESFELVDSQPLSGFLGQRRSVKVLGVSRRG